MAGEPESRSTMWRVLGWLGKALDLFRRVVSALSGLGLLVFLLVLLFGSMGPRVPRRAVLELAITGDIVEQLSGQPWEKLFQRAAPGEEPETLLWDAIDAVEFASGDARIVLLLLDLTRMKHASLAALGELEAAMAKFKKAGKKVVAYADDYSQQAYHLAATADEIYLHSQGSVTLEGFSKMSLYFKDALDRLEIRPNVIRVGEYKSALEPLLYNQMSVEDRQASLAYLQDLWSAYLAHVSASRRLAPKDLQGAIDGAVELTRAHGGDLSGVAKQIGLVDRVGGREDLRRRLLEWVGEDQETHSFPRIDHRGYLDALSRDRARARTSSNVIAVVVASGTIEDGDHPPGVVGGDSTAALLQKARLDPQVKAIVLRVDSPGGSSFASEIIREECALVRAAGKPVVVSLGGVAASGGYWIATAADEIWASPDTITGSIGVFSMLPTLDRTLSKFLGAHMDGVGTTWRATAYHPFKGLMPEMAEIERLVVERVYKDFLSRVATARKMTVEQVDPIARGRVYCGGAALKLGLLDKLGGLEQAISSAARRARVENDYRSEYLEKELPWQERWLFALMTSVAARFPTSRGLLSRLSAGQLPDALGSAGKIWAQLGPRKGPLAHCFCDWRS